MTTDLQAAELLIRDVLEATEVDLSQHEASLAKLVRRARWAYNTSEDYPPIFRDEAKHNEFYGIKADPDLPNAGFPPDTWSVVLEVRARHIAGRGHQSRNYTVRGGPEPRDLVLVHRALKLWWRFHLGTEFDAHKFRRVKDRPNPNPETKEPWVWKYALPGSSLAAVLFFFLAKICNPDYDLQNVASKAKNLRYNSTRCAFPA